MMESQLNISHGDSLQTQTGFAADHCSAGGSMQRARPCENPRSTNCAASAYPPVASACSVATDIHLRKSLTHACRRAMPSADPCLPLTPCLPPSHNRPLRQRDFRHGFYTDLHPRTQDLHGVVIGSQNPIFIINAASARLPSFTCLLVQAETVHSPCTDHPLLV